MRLLLGLAVVLVLTGALAGCLERRGSLEVRFEVSSIGAVGEFSSINLSLDRVRIDARTLNPEDVPTAVQRFELVSAARSRESFVLFREEVRADRYTKVSLLAPIGATFEGVLRNGTKVGMVLPNNAIVVPTDFEVPRGGDVAFLVSMKVEKAQGAGAPLYSIVPDTEGSRLV